MQRMLKQRRVKPMTPPGSILMFGKDALLLETRKQVLKAAGFDTRSVMTVAEFKRAIAEGRWRVLILCHTLSEAECSLVLAAAAAHAPEMPIFTLRSGFSARAIVSVESIEVLNGPKRLLERVSSLFHTLFVTNTQAGPRRVICHST